MEEGHYHGRHYSDEEEDDSALPFWGLGTNEDLDIGMLQLQLCRLWLQLGCSCRLGLRL